MKAADDRDRAIERLLQQSFKTPAAPTDACLDAETLAAWADGGLSGAARAMAESHVADCARCQAIMSTAARIEAIAPVHVGPLSRRWLAWIVPLTAAAAAVAIWVAVPHGPSATPQQHAETASPSVQAKAPESPGPGAQLQEPGARREAPTTSVKSDAPSRDQAQAPELRKDAGRRELDRLKQESQTADRAGVPADKLAAAAAPAAATPPSPAARETFQDPSANSASASQKAAGGAIASLAVAVRWRISGMGLEHSMDGGSTWSSVSTGVTSELTAVSSPSSTVCWVVGRGGVVLRTTDGRSFSRSAFPEVTDLSAVQATDGQSATVTASDGRVFTTSDGGRTWRNR